MNPVGRVEAAALIGRVSELQRQPTVDIANRTLRDCPKKAAVG